MEDFCYSVVDLFISAIPPYNQYGNEPLMKIEQLFINTLDDLDEKLESHSEYDTLMIALLLRKLLLDENPLIDLTCPQ